MRTVALIGLVLVVLGWWLPWLTGSGIDYDGGSALGGAAEWAEEEGYITPWSHVHLLVGVFVVEAALLLWSLRDENAWLVSIAAFLGIVITLIQWLLVTNAMGAVFGMGNGMAFQDIEWREGTMVMLFGQALLLYGAFSAWVEQRVKDKATFEIEYLSSRITTLEKEARERSGQRPL